MISYYNLDFTEHELQSDWRKCVELSSGQIYLIEPLPFRGFLAFDPEFLYIYLGPKDDKHQCQCSDAIKLRKSMVISAIIPID